MKVKIYGYEAEMPVTTQIRNNFILQELANNSGVTTEPQFIIDRDVDEFLNMVQELRLWFAKPIVINSCYRQKNFNAQVGGDPRSAHLHACAIDWGISGHTPTQRKNVQDKWADICRAHKVIGAINHYTHGYHLEAFSNKWYGSKAFEVRDYRGKKGDW